MKIILTGAKGQLGREFVKTFQKRETEFIALSREELDISDPPEDQDFQPRAMIKYARNS